MLTTAVVWYCRKSRTQPAAWQWRVSVFSPELCLGSASAMEDAELREAMSFCCVDTIGPWLSSQTFYALAAHRSKRTAVQTAVPHPYWHMLFVHSVHCAAGRLHSPGPSLPVGAGGGRAWLGHLSPAPAQVSSAVVKQAAGSWQLSSLSVRFPLVRKPICAACWSAPLWIVPVPELLASAAECQFLLHIHKSYFI